MNDIWFRWEREASIHLLFPTLEGSMEPLKAYVGFGFPLTVLIFKDGVVTWCMKEAEFMDLGERLRNIFVSSRKEKQFAKDLRNSIKVLQRVEATIQKTDLNNLTDTQLVKLYRKLYSNFLIFYAIGSISTPMSFETESYLKQNSKISDTDFNLLTHPKRDSYIREAEKYLLKTKDIEGFIDKYYWIDNNYSQTKVLTQKEVLMRLKEIESHKRLKRAYSKTKLSASNNRLIELLRNYALYKDNRKKHIWIFLHFLETLLKEVSRRIKLPMTDLRNTFPQEIALILAGKFSKTKIGERKKYCVVVWKEDAKKPQILTGYKAKKWEKIVYQKSKEGIKTILGQTACSGLVRGKVRVLLSAKDCYKLEKGEVLVTFMTSPDFMSAIRKCSAIVTNFGGVTSHAAIISRELNVPCIVGTKIATHVLKTGDLVEVNANNGIVRLLS